MHDDQADMFVGEALSDAPYEDPFEEFVALNQRIAACESELDRLKEKKEQLCASIHESLTDLGTSHRRVGGYTVFIRRSTHVRFPERPSLTTCEALTHAGWGYFTALQVVNKHDLAKFIDRNGIPPRLRRYVELHEGYTIQLRKGKS